MRTSVAHTTYALSWLIHTQNHIDICNLIISIHHTRTDILSQSAKSNPYNCSSSSALKVTPLSLNSTCTPGQSLSCTANRTEDFCWLHNTRGQTLYTMTIQYNASTYWTPSPHIHTTHSVCLLANTVHPASGSRQESEIILLERVMRSYWLPFWMQYLAQLQTLLWTESSMQGRMMIQRVSKYEMWWVILTIKKWQWGASQ